MDIIKPRQSFVNILFTNNCKFYFLFKILTNLPCLTWVKKSVNAHENMLYIRENF